MRNITRKSGLEYRHGDVGLVVSNVPKTATRVAIRPLAYGEQTGHHHSVVETDADGVEMYEHDGRSFLRVTKEGGISIVHQEHAEMRIAPGEYEIRIAREYDEENDFRSVQD